MEIRWMPSCNSYMKPKWMDYFFSIATTAAENSSCGRRQVGAIIEKDKSIISTGYNGTPRGLKNCNRGGCLRFKHDGDWPLEDSMCVHAEENAIIQAARVGVSVNGSNLFCTLNPCLKCSKMIINAGITAVYFKEIYPDSEEALKTLNRARVHVWWIGDKIHKVLNRGIND